MNSDYFIITGNDEVVSFAGGAIVIYGDKQDAIDDMYPFDKLGTLIYSKDKDENQIAEVYVESTFIGEFVYDDKMDNFQTNFRQFIIEHSIYTL